MEMPIPHLAMDEGPYDDLLSDSDNGEEDQVDEITEEAARWKFIKPPPSSSTWMTPTLFSYPKQDWRRLVLCSAY
ncbi:hypothetical protein F443_00254 [Phytophthora nicotianae P1569]|uniref:Uncharacterized protein n=1 Tax=Phytophthora nicotianae P1569 TaxID=1317065 RepID=V9G142_PHYNI|nr:hypothetical protein F443_00254 [Phytophthora nicotianae P1569]